MTEHDKSQEVDLLYFLRPISDGARQLGRFGARSVSHAYRNKWTIIGLLLAAAAIAYSLRFILPKSYKSDAVFISRTLKSQVCTDLINNLGSLVSGDNASLLSKQLNISPEQARAIRSIQAKTQTDNTFIDERDSAVSLFRVTVSVADNKLLPAVQAGIISFLENNELVVKRKETRRKYLQEQNAVYERRSRSLDSLKQMVNGRMASRRANEGIVIDPVSPIDVFEAEELLLKEWANVRQQIEMSNSIVALQPFLQPDVPNHPNFTKLFIYIVGGMVILIALVIALQSLRDPQRITV
jgi:hypothetical protein